jgi:hypothetical protein
LWVCVCVYLYVFYTYRDLWSERGKDSYDTRISRRWNSYRSVYIYMWCVYRNPGRWAQHLIIVDALYIFNICWCISSLSIITSPQRIPWIQVHFTLLYALLYRVDLCYCCVYMKYA